MEQNKQNTSQGEVWIDEDGILYQDYPPGTEITIEDSLGELKIYRTTFCKEVRRPIIVDISNIKTVSKESRDIYSSNETAEILSAAALIVSNPVSRIMGNFYMGISKTMMPVRMFATTKEAKNWLKDFLP
jgi:hypothetical protein